MHTQLGSRWTLREAPGYIFLSQVLVETLVSLGVLWSKTGLFSNYVEFLRIPAKS